MSNPITYKDAGVDIERGDALVEKIKSKVQSTYGKRVLSGVGGFACLYDIDGDRMLAAGTDGVGTKLMIAQKLGIHNTIGIDLVAMCSNDVLCTGAKGLFFMDYLATGQLNLGVSEQILDGIIEGCRQAKLALIGGETAEMPGMYPPGKYDLAGFAVGEVFKDSLIDGKKVKAGDSLIGIESSGIHSNGLSLARRLAKENDDDFLHALLTPTKIYTDVIEALQNQNLVNGLAHITGGGLSNIARVNSDFDYIVDSFPALEELPPIIKTLTIRSKLPDYELFKTFNMGVGMVVISSRPSECIKTMNSFNIRSWKIGDVIPGEGNVLLTQNKHTIKL